MSRTGILLLLIISVRYSCAQNVDSLLSKMREANTPPEKWELWAQITQAYQLQGNDSAYQRGSVQLLQTAIESKNDTLVFNTYLVLGAYYENKADFNHALENHFKALRVAEKANILPGICMANEQAAVVYKQLNDNAQALFHLKQAMKLLDDPGVKSLTPWLFRAVYANMAQIYLQLGKPDSAFVFAQLGFESVDKENDVFGYAQLLDIMAGVYARQQKAGLAESYYKQGIAFSDSVNEDISLVTTLFDYCLFLLDQGRTEEARKYGLRSLAEHNKRFNRVGTLSIKIADVLAKVYSANHQFDSAYYYSAQRDSQKDSVFNQQRLTAIGNLTFSEKIKETEEKMERQEESIRQKQKQLYLLLAALLLVAIIAYLSYRSYINKKRDALTIQKEKDRSDNLLLNILPQETAEELKANGFAEAKSFEQVTVMFTDFKNFTQASEKMSAKELVSEINLLFSEFDKIISKYDIEKIKTIGDSYMCAGGLPVPNDTNAADLVRAALEIQQFMKQLQEDRKKMNQDYFEIRVGIHTGPVVAGIVGIKKFAYDIWGDTVNIASRMESSGETGKVNISGETYELVKEQFHCTYRGKIRAKNKGEIDMYFVNGTE